MTDKNCVTQIIGSLMKNPSFLSQSDKYQILVSDFPNAFTKRIFGSILNLYADGSTKINPIDIENSLSYDAAALKSFKEKNGIEYLQDAIELSDVETFDYYYKKLKKINLINDLNKKGFDTSEFYCEDLTDFGSIEINRKFDELEIKDIIEKIKKKIIKIENEYNHGDVSEASDASEGMEELIESFGEGLEVGEPLQGEIFSQICAGAGRGKFFIRSGASGVSKTRQAVGDACFLAYPFRYDHEKDQWVNVGNFQKVLFIATEQSKEEIQKMILAYITGINESNIKYNKLSEKERKILSQAVWVTKQYQNFIICRMPNPTIELVKTIVRENCIVNDCRYVFYDYIFISPSLINEFKGVNLRNDEILLMFSTALKDLAVELNIFVMTSTQLNAKGDENKEIRNEAALAGSRAVINKADFGAIMARPTREELQVISDLGVAIGAMPNIVTDVYKNRGGEFTQVRIWSYVDLGTLRKQDLVVTNSRLERIDKINSACYFTFEDNRHSMEVIEGLAYLND